ncbi:L-threonylcarbamoyladenylate synthase [Methylocapsa acidiphila]|uniref:L-threonylcarbamoyladenylate synthase n=1 Tax=Methylocapsa acidiphila TaxID=133552 RepID=UPI000560DD5F|nr:L-threonylcarbamoyladenylate synthase [Methylocapsa acidiphila]
MKINPADAPRPLADEGAIEEAAHILREGGLVAFPTETVYGLGADATSDAAVARIFAAKGRPSFNPLIAHVEGLAAAQELGVFSEEAGRLAEAFWPGPLTLVLPLAPGASVSALARAGLDSVALRAPAHPVARALIAAVGRPLAAPSANRSGRVSPVSAAHVAQDLARRVDFILDGGPSPIGVESTIVSCLDGGPRLLRPGGIATEAIEAALGLSLAEAAPGKIVAPGALASHYAPRAKLRLDAIDLDAYEAGLDFGGRFRIGPMIRDLSPGGDLQEAAANLFAFLRELDALGASRIAVAPIPHHGLGEAINDRLARAAAPRPKQT